MANGKYTNFTTPKGTLFFPSLTTPDTKFNADGVYTCRMLLDPEDSKVLDFLTFIEDKANAVLEAAKEAESNAKKVAKMNLYLPYSNAEDKDGNETGMILLKVSSKHAPTIYDSQRNQTNVEVPGGSVVQAAGFLSEWGPIPASGACGVSLKLQKVMIHELGQGFSGGADEFEDSVDGFVSDGAEFAQTSGVAGEAVAAGSDF